MLPLPLVLSQKTTRKKLATLLFEMVVIQCLYFFKKLCKIVQKANKFVKNLHLQVVILKHLFGAVGSRTLEITATFRQYLLMGKE